MEIYIFEIRVIFTVYHTLYPYIKGLYAKLCRYDGVSIGLYFCHCFSLCLCLCFTLILTLILHPLIK